MQIDGRVFVVTGGGNGIGREVVLLLLRNGARVAALDLRGEALAETARLANAGDRLTLHTVDVSDNLRVEAVADEVAAAHGPVDGLVNVAGIIQRFVDFTELDLAEIEKVMAVNFWGVVHTTKAFLPVLMQRPEASLVNVASMGAFVPVPGQSVYGASKAAVMLLTEGLYAELQDSRIAVSAVYPGAIETGIATNSEASIPQPTGDAPSMKMTPAPEAGRQIVEAIEKGSPRVRIGNDAKLLDVLSRLMPVKATEFVAKKMASIKG